MELVTPRGTFACVCFDSIEEATREGFGYYFSFGRWDIYTRSDTENWHTDFAAVLRSR